MPSIVLKLTPEYHNAIKTLALRQRRSIASQLRLFIDDGLRANEIDPLNLQSGTKPVPKQQPSAAQRKSISEEIEDVDWDSIDSDV